MTATAIELSTRRGSSLSVRKLAAGATAAVPEAEAVVGYELASCPREVRATLDREADPVAAAACWRALQARTAVLADLPAERANDVRSALFAASMTDVREAAARALPELVAIALEGGPLAGEVHERLAALGWTTPGEQLRRVPRTRRPELLTVLGRDDEGASFGLLARAALESSIAAERQAAIAALAEYPEDAVARLSAALDDPAGFKRERAAAALAGQDGRALEALRTAVRAVGEDPGDRTFRVRAAGDAEAHRLASLLVRASDRRRADRRRALEIEARDALRDGRSAEAAAALERLAETDRARWGELRALRAESHVAAAQAALEGGGALGDRGGRAALELANAQALDPQAPGVVDVALRIAEAFLRAGYPVSAARVLEPYEDRDGRAERLRLQAVRDEVRRLVAAGDERGARQRLVGLVQEGRPELADELDDRYALTATHAWMAPLCLGLLLCATVGIAVQRERRRRRVEFALINGEQARGAFHHGPYR